MITVSNATEKCENQRKTRASRPKVRSGCVVCKSRHKKCDEQRPSCLMCTSTGRKCEYRETPDRRTRVSRIIASSDDNRNQVNIQPRRMPESPSTPLGLMAPLMQGGVVDLTPDERWYLSYFRKFTSLQCSSYFYDEFWERLVHQASDIQPAVRHAVIGMGALNWQFLQLRMGTHTGPLDRRFSLQQCNRAISHLQENLSDDGLGRTKVETALMTCLVLVCVILFQEDAESVGRHIKAGENLLKQYLCENPRPSSMSRALKQTFAGTRLVYTTFASQSSAKDDPVSPWLVPDEPPSGDENVQKVNDFLSTLARMIIQNHPYGFRVTSTDPDLDLEPFAVMSKLRGWRTQLRATLAVHKGLLAQRDSDTLILLDVWVEVLAILIVLNMRAQPLQTEYDSFTPNFEKAIHLAGELLNSTNQSCKPTFPVNTGIIPALVFCVLKCRDCVIRQKALLLLRQWQFHEESSMTSPMAVVLQRVIEIEMRGLTPVDMVPESARIESIVVEIPRNDSVIQFQYRLSQHADLNEQADQPWRVESLVHEPRQQKITGN